jgi:branched-chain amino acid transport system substrate-binding protein
MRVRFDVRREVPERGFPLTVFVETKTGQKIFQGYLPPLPAELEQRFEAWREAYLGLGAVSMRLTPRPTRTNVSYSEVDECVQQLEEAMNRWLNSGADDWQHIKEELSALPEAARNHRETSIFLDVEDKRLLRFPWQEWRFFEKRFPHAEITFSSRRDAQPLQTRSSRWVKILVVVGNSDGIEQGIEEDIKALRSLEAKKGAKIKLLPQPNRRDLLDHLWDQTYEMFVFTGHSGSDNNKGIGWIELSRTDRLRISELKEPLRAAIDKGLRICLFNSCDGLGLANQLVELNLPVTIVMREPVPDEVAARFLCVFLEKFSDGDSIFSAFWKARQRLRGEFNSQYPGVRWLPKIFMGNSVMPPTWKQLGGKAWHLQQKWVLAVGLLASCSAVTVGVLMFPPRPSDSPQSSSQRPLLTPAAFKVRPADQVMSAGEKVLSEKSLAEPYVTWKTDGIRALNEQKPRYQDAITSFDRIRNTAKQDYSTYKDATTSEQKEKRNKALEALQDPEVLVYRNNAEARRRSQQSGGVPVRKIAVVAPMNMDQGKQVLWGVAQAQNKAVNQQNLNLELMIADDFNHTEQAKTIGEELGRRKDILAVIGHYSSKITCAVLPTYQKYQLPLVSSTSTVLTLRSCGNNTVFFRTTSTTKIEAKELINYLVDQSPNRKNNPKVAVFYKKDEPFSEDLYFEFKSALRSRGGEVSDFNLSDQDAVQKSLQQLQNFDALAVFPDAKTDTDTEFNTAVQVVKATKGKTLILGANTLAFADVLSEIKESSGDDALKKLVIPVDWDSMQSSASQTFIREARAEWGGDVNRRTALSYEAAQAIQAVLLSQPPINTSAEVVKALRQIKTDSNVFVGRKISFDTEGNRNEITSRFLVTGDFNGKDFRFVRVDGTR